MKFLLVVLVSALSLTAGTVADAGSCQQVVVAGDPNWAPYTLVPDDDTSGVDVQGLGMELLGKIFAELEIPMIKIAQTEERRIWHGLNLGDIDLLVSVYQYPEIGEIAELIQPGYIEDPIRILVNKQQAAEIAGWDDLIGKRGAATETFRFSTKFLEYADKYLYVHTAGSLASIISNLQDNKVDYLVGSELQLRYGIKKYGMQQQLVLVPRLAKPSVVYFALSKQSACRGYMPFIKRRLADFQREGWVAQLAEQYIVDTASTEKQPEKSQFDFLFYEEEVEQ